MNISQQQRLVVKKYRDSFVAQGVQAKKLDIFSLKDAASLLQEDNDNSLVSRVKLKMHQVTIIVMVM